MCEYAPPTVNFTELFISQINSLKNSLILYLILKKLQFFSTIFSLDNDLRSNLVGNHKKKQQKGIIFNNTFSSPPFWSSYICVCLFVCISVCMSMCVCMR